MTKRINSLTDEQKARLPEWRDKWIEIGLRTGDTDWDRGVAGLKVAYSKAGTDWPGNVVRVQSPVVGAFAAGIADRMLRGSAVGSAVDSAVRDAVGDAVRIAVGSAVGDAVRIAVRIAVGGAVGSAVRIAVDSAVDSAVGSAAGSAVRIAVDSAVRDAVRIAVGSAVGDAVRIAVGGAVGSAVRIAVDSAVDSAVARHRWIGGQFWVGWWWGSPSYVSFFTDVCGLELSQDILERVKAYRDICESVNYVWPNRKFVMICARPDRISRDTDGRLHHETKKAIVYPDGWGVWCLDGVMLEKQQHHEIVSGRMKFADILKIENADVQAVAFKYNPQAIVAEGAEIVHRSERGNELLKITGQEINRITEFDEMYFLRMACPTGRTFIEGVEPEFAKAHLNADTCQAELLGLTRPQYDSLRVEG